MSVVEFLVGQRVALSPGTEVLGVSDQWAGVVVSVSGHGYSAHYVVDFDPGGFNDWREVRRVHGPPSWFRPAPLAGALEVGDRVRIHTRGEFPHLDGVVGTIWGCKRSSAGVALFVCHEMTGQGGDTFTAERICFERVDDGVAPAPLATGQALVNASDGAGGTTWEPFDIDSSLDVSRREEETRALFAMALWPEVVRHAEGDVARVRKVVEVMWSQPRYAAQRAAAEQAATCLQIWEELP